MNRSVESYSSIFSCRQGTGAAEFLDGLLYESISVLASNSTTSRQGVESPEDIEDLVKDTVHSEEFKFEEMKKRLNENLRFYVDLSSTDELSATEIEDEIDSVVATKKSRIQTKLQEVETEVDNAISNDELGNLNGKLILSYIASKFGLQNEQLKRVVADKIAQEDQKPNGLEEIIIDLFDSIGETYPEETSS
ncbi:hypothetical protein ACTG0T_03540 [Halococcus morrhuae DSM 1307]